MKIGIIGAMELEVATLKQELTQVTCREVAGMKFFDGMLEQTWCRKGKCRNVRTDLT